MTTSGVMPAARCAQVARPAPMGPQRALWWSAVLALLWGSAIFEAGLDFFAERIGLTVFMYAALLLLSSAAGAVVTDRLRVWRTGWIQAHSLLVSVFVVYWLIAWVGVLYTPWRALPIALVACIQYLWYTVLTLVTIAILSQMRPADRRRLVGAIGIVSVVMLLFFTVLSLVTGVAASAALREAGKFSIGVFRDYNVFAFSLILGIMLILCGSTAGKLPTSPRQYLLYAALVGVAVLLGTLAGSRRTLVFYGPVALSLPLLLLWRRSRAHLATTVVWTAMLLGVAGAALGGRIASAPDSLEMSAEAVEATTERTRRAIGFLTGEYADTRSRTGRWAAALDLADGYSPVELMIGKGTRSYVATPQFTRAEGGMDTPHNFVFAALLEGGILKLGVLTIFVLAWLQALLREARRQTFWVANFLVGSSLLWLFSVSISGEEFFSSKHFMLIMVVYAAFWSGWRDRVAEA